MSAIDRLKGLVGSVAIKAPCRLATTANITLNGLQTVDGVSVASGDRVLVHNQTTTTANGIYVADTGDWARDVDFAGSGDCVQGTMVPVVQGTLYNGTVWQLTTASPVIGTSALAFSILGTGALSGVSAYIQTLLPALTALASRAILGAVGLTGNETVAGDKTLSGTLAMSGKPINEAHGADIASAGTIDLGAATGNVVDVTGTTGVTAITLGDGLARTVRFTGALTLTNGASLVLPGGANITTAAGDFAIFRGYAAGVVRCVSYSALTGYPVKGALLQAVSSLSSAVATGIVVMPYDDTIPQNTEGDQYMSLAITPKSATSLLKITVVWNGSGSVIDNISLGLFQDSTAGALKAVSGLTANVGGAPQATQIMLVHEMTSGTTSATTFKVRAGLASAGTTTFNGLLGARKLGGVMASSVTIEEIAA